MTWRTAHGNQARRGKNGKVWESVPDGVRAVEPACAAPIERDPAGRFTRRGAAAAARRRQELAKVPDLAKGELAFIPTEDFAPFDMHRRELLSTRMSEVVTATGSASSGVMTSLRGYSWLVAFAEFYAQRAAKTGSDADADRSRRFFKDASVELAKAHELARVESARKPGAVNPILAAIEAAGEAKQ